MPFRLEETTSKVKKEIVSAFTQHRQVETSEPLCVAEGSWIHNEMKHTSLDSFDFITLHFSNAGAPDRDTKFHLGTDISFVDGYKIKCVVSRFLENTQNV